MKISRAFDRAAKIDEARGGGNREPALPRAERGRRLMSVKTALEWAFGPEQAQIDFDLLGVHEFRREGISPEWRLMQEQKLGCRVDGGGSSDPHADAALIAAAVEALSVNPIFGKDMAVLMATCARSGTVPDWRGEPKMRVAPLGWDINKDGERTAYEVPAGTWSYRSPANRMMRTVRSRVCPIQYVGGAISITRARRRYLDWWGALLEVSVTLRIPGYLDSIEISKEMPAVEPWREKSV